MGTRLNQPLSLLWPVGQFSAIDGSAHHSGTSMFLAFLESLCNLLQQSSSGMHAFVHDAFGSPVPRQHFLGGEPPTAPAPAFSQRKIASPSPALAASLPLISNNKGRSVGRRSSGPSRPGQGGRIPLSLIYLSSITASSGGRNIIVCTRSPITLVGGFPWAVEAAAAWQYILPCILGQACAYIGMGALLPQIILQGH